MFRGSFSKSFTNASDVWESAEILGIQDERIFTVYFFKIIATSSEVSYNRLISRVTNPNRYVDTCMRCTSAGGDASCVNFLTLRFINNCRGGVSRAIINRTFVGVSPRR